MSDELARPGPFEEGGQETEDKEGPRRVVTLLTDFGNEDHYVSVMKGVILEINPEVQIVDITHSIQPFDVKAGAFTLGTAYHYFPKGTIHVAVVDPGVGGDQRGVMVATENYLFVGPDNGIFSYAYEDPAYLWTRELRAIEFFLEKVSSTFHGRDIFAPVAGYLSEGEDPQSFGPIITDPVKIESVHARVEADGTIWGEVIAVDRFGNLITNIDTATFWEGETRTGAEEHTFRPVILIGGTSIRGMSEFYQAAAPGTLATHFNSWSRLEIFVPQGNAAQMLGVGKGAPVTVQFEVDV